MSVSLAAVLAEAPTAELAAAVRDLTDQQAARILYDWRVWARPEQLAPPGDWNIWLTLSGRGWGKTRTGCEWVRSRVESEASGRIALVAPTAADARDVLVEGQSGILAISPPWFRPHYEPSRRRLTWPNGAVATTFSADEPDRLRGPQFDAALCDELATWRYPETFDMLQLGLRLGTDPRCVVLTTPKPTPILRALVAPDRTDVVVTRGTTFDNRDNLAPAFLAQATQLYASSRLGRQELMGELLEDVEGALWTLAMIDRSRLRAVPDGVSLSRVVVGVDPPASATGAECGIVVVARGDDNRGYVLADYSRRGSPHEWASAAVQAFDDWEADAVVIEVNQGGDMATNTLKTVRKHLPIKAVHAARGKAIRAQPVSALYEQDKVSHVGSFPALESQMTEWVPGDDSPDRLDALVWSCAEVLPVARRTMRVF